MLFLLSGSSGSGKSTALRLLEERVDNLLGIDLDAVVPEAPTPGFWNRAVERAVRSALAAETAGQDAVLAGWTPLGELLATPSATGLEGIAACHLDCDDSTRLARLMERAKDWGVPSDEQLGEIMRFSDWLRCHYADPAWDRDEKRASAWREMRWERWSRWERGDARWAVHRIDTTDLSVDEVGDELVEWIEEQRALRNRGALPLSGRWWNERSG